MADERRLMAAIHRLSNDSDFKFFLEWFKEEKKAFDLMLRDSPDSLMVFRAQGAVQLGDKVIEKVNTAQHG